LAQTVIKSNPNCARNCFFVRRLRAFFFFECFCYASDSNHDYGGVPYIIKSDKLMNAMRLLATILLITLCSLGYSSQGVLLMGDDPILVGRAGAGIATPEDAFWINLNPAGIVDLGRRADFTLSVIGYELTMHTKGAGRIPMSEKVEDEEVMGLPSASFVWPSETGVWGLSFQIPTGACVHFPQSRTWVGEMEGGTDANLEYVQPRLTLAYAHKLDCDWAIGFSLIGSFSAGRTDYATARAVSTKGNNEWDYSFGAGVSVGIYRTWDKWSFASALKTRQWSEVFEKYRDVTSYPVDLPLTLHSGLAYKITPKLQIEFDHRFINWGNSKFFHEDNSSLGLGWKDQHAFMLGLEWEAAPKWTFRIGYGHVTPALSNEHLFGSAIVPNVVTDQAGIGFSYSINDHSEFHAALARWFPGKLAESGDGDIYSQIGAGSESTLQVSWLTLGYGVKF
jgi:long-chain fatty acid transport protein